MSTIIVNGSPKGNSKTCNSKIIAEHFIRGMRNPCEIRCLAGSDYPELAGYIEGFNTVLFILPLYIHAMPGGMMKFLEVMRPASSPGKRIGFIVQAGFIESAQHRFLQRYFEDLAGQLKYTYLGTVSKGEAAGIYMFPKMFRKVLAQFVQLGMAFEETGAFDEEIVRKLSKPYELSKGQVRLLGLVDALGLSNIGWHSKLRKNGAYKDRLATPFLEIT